VVNWLQINLVIYIFITGPKKAKMMSIDTKTFENLLVVLENDENMAVPLARAARLCKLFSAKMTIFVSFYTTMHGARQADLVDDLGTIVSHHKSAIYEQLASGGASEFIENIILSWKQVPSLAVKKIISAHNFDLVLKTPYQQNDFKKLFKSGLDHYFVSECPLPVWMVKPRLWDNDIEVLACVDMNDEDFNNHLLNKKILATSDKLAGAMGAQMHVVDCYFGEIGSLNINYNSKRGFKREATIREQHVEKLKLYITEYSLADDQLHFEEGIADDALPQTAVALNAEVTVIGNNEDTNYLARLFGDTAVALIKDMPCDILVLKPDVFDT
jgi:universal stress protein E